MPVFSSQSVKKLSECDHHLSLFFNIIVGMRDCTILCGFRPEEQQNEAFKQGYSKVKYPNSKHNLLPSMGVDVAPYFSDRPKGKRVSLNRYEVVEFGHYCLGVRDCLNLKPKIRWGGDWDRDFLTLTDNEFLDAFHWEIV